MRNNSKHAGAYGRLLTAHFAKQQATPERLATHQQHLQHAAERRTKRALASGASVLQLLAA